MMHLRKKTAMSIKKTLRLTIILFSIIPIIIVSILSYQLISNRLVTIERENLQNLAETNSNGLEAVIKIQQTEVDLLSIQYQLYNLALNSQLVSKSKSPYYNAIYKNASDLLVERRKLYNFCEKITLYNANKQVVTSSDKSFVDTDYSSSVTLSYMKATGSNASGISGVIENTNEANETTYCIEIGCPIINKTVIDSPILGYIVSTLNLSYFEEFMSSIKIGKTGYGMLLDKSGTIVYHPDTEMIGTNMDSSKLRELVNNYNTGNIPESGTFEYYYEGKQSLFGYHVIPSLDWVLLVKQDVSKIIDLANIILYILGCIVVVLIVVIIIVSNSVTTAYTDPIIELKNVMRTASDGNLEVHADIKYKNELGELSRIFNKMLHIIKSNYNDLTAMHEVLVTNEEQLRSNYSHIEYLAYHDALTNLPNKVACIERVISALSSSPGSNKLHAVYFVDLDNFKTINDTLGHDYGDYLLTQTAERLISMISSEDVLARAGGDEFLLLRENIDSQSDATDFAAAVIDAFKKPFNLHGEIAYVSLSIGIALYPKNGTTAKALIKNADIAMYKSKDTGKNKFTLFDMRMEAELNRNTVIIEVLRHAIQSQEVFIKYQPQVNISNNKIIGFEALMRINSSKLGNLSPKEFIPIAEESGLIVELGEWILREACAFNKSLYDQGFSPYIVSVNISSVQINRTGFITMLDSILKETHLLPQYLELEITESTLVSSLLDATTLLNSIQALGVRISLDDFGTGYSSLNYLTSMPINTLKIDKSFIDNIGINEKDAYIAETIIQLAHSINVEVIAEGVENQEQLDLLKRNNCDIVQGFIYSEPLLPSALKDILN